jgi:tetratricopeptide (TPR) repeat protein
MKTNIKRILLLFFTLTIFSFPGFSQKIGTDQRVERYMQEGKAFMEQGDYESANITFRKILATKTVIPTDMCFYFAETLYQIGQYENSKNFVKKYINLAGEKGEFYVQARSLEEKLTKKLSENADCTLCDDKGYRLDECKPCKGEGLVDGNCHYCRGNGVASCLPCQGKGVIISSAAHQLKDKTYKTCFKCDTKGYIKCPICEGKKIVEYLCKECSGKGYHSTKNICNHKD